MKKFLFSFLMAMTTVSSLAQDRILVLYYSYTNNVHQVMQQVQSQLDIPDADVARIQPADKTQKYEANNYAIGTALLNAIKANPNDTDSYPAIDALDIDFSKYKYIIIGTPLWWSQMAAITQSFLFCNAAKMSGKDVYLIVSSASSSIGGVEEDARRLLPNSRIVAPSLWIRSSQIGSASSRVSEWIKSTGIDKITAGISNATTSAKSNYSSYNLAGQKVDASYQGVIIQNGHKIVKNRK